MSKTIVDSGENNIHAVIWQGAEDYPGEPAVVVKYYAGDQLIAVVQEGREILLNITTIPALIRELRKLQKDAMG